MRKRIRMMMKGFALPLREEFLQGSFPVDVAETDDELVIKADLPGFEKADVAIRVTENTIDIAAQHKQKKIEQKENYFRAERSMGALRRYLALPAEVNPDTAKAKMENGVLEIRLKKAKPTKKAKKVQVQ